MPSIDESEIAQRLRALCEQSREHAILLADPEGRVQWWSAGAAILFGYEADQIVGKPMDVLFTPEERASGFPQHERDVAQAHDEAEDDRWMQRADGSRFWATGMLSPIRDAEGRLLGYGKIMRNRTDLREQIETLRKSNAVLQEVHQRKDSFMSTLSHELRNPLGPLANAVHLIRMGPSSRVDIEHALKIIERQMDILRRLVDDLLDTARIGAGKVTMNLEPVPLQPLLAEVVDASRPSLEQKRHDLRLVLPEGLIEVEGDRQRLHQVFFNLLQNAIKYTPSTGIIWVKATVEGDEAVTRFEDNGIGIATDMLPRIFEMFTQVEGAQSVSPGGLGIGLALVKQLVALHKGSIQVRSDGPGKGSEFVVRLPLKRLHQA